MNWENSKAITALKRDFLKRFAARNRDFFLTGGSAWRSSTMVRHPGDGHTFTHAPHPIQVSRLNSGLPLYLSGTWQGAAGNLVVNRRPDSVEDTAITASFNSLSFGQRNFGLLYFSSRPVVSNPTRSVFSANYGFFLPASSAYLSTTLPSHICTPAA